MHTPLLREVSSDRTITLITTRITPRAGCVWVGNGQNSNRLKAVWTRINVWLIAECIQWKRRDGMLWGAGVTFGSHGEIAEWNLCGIVEYGEVGVLTSLVFVMRFLMLLRLIKGSADLGTVDRWRDFSGV